MYFWCKNGFTMVWRQKNSYVRRPAKRNKKSRQAKKIWYKLIQLINYAGKTDDITDKIPC